MSVGTAFGIDDLPTAIGLLASAAVCSNRLAVDDHFALILATVAARRGVIDRSDLNPIGDRRRWLDINHPRTVVEMPLDTMCMTPITAIAMYVADAAPMVAVGVAMVAVLAVVDGSRCRPHAVRRLLMCYAIAEYRSDQRTGCRSDKPPAAFADG